MNQVIETMWNGYRRLDFTFLEHPAILVCPNNPREEKNGCSKPNIPTEVSNGETVLAPCEIKIDTKPRNYENPELYSVFPYGLYGVGKPDLDLACQTYDQRLYRLEAGWSQDPIDAALLGLTDEAAKHLVRQSAMTDVRALFPAFWGPNFDETPDQDHGCVTALCLIHMLLQTDGETYTAFPAWPEKWNVRFKLPIKC